jgi:hypothetical protein
MTDAIFPTRVLRVKPPKQASLFGAVLVFLTCLAVTLGMAWWQGPDLMRDFRIKDNVEPAINARLVKAKCRSKLIIHMCDAEIAHKVGDEQMISSQGFGFLDLHLGSYSTTILQERGNPAVVTTSLAMESLWNRVLTTGGFIALFVVCSFGGLKMISTAWRDNNRFSGLDRHQLTPLLMDVYGYNDTNDKKRIWYYGAPDSDPEKAHSVCYKPERLPFFLDEEGSKGLAVTSPDAKQPLLLDHALTYLTLTDEERNKLVHWRQSMIERQKMRRQQEAAPAQG